MMDSEGKFYLGRHYDLESHQISDRPLLYDPDDLTTHGVVVGMTGSGKTGLCIDLLEEAALQGIPALMIDPKGDITNSLLHFPDLLPVDFQDWINPDLARREGKTIEQAAEETARAWRQGLESWDIGPERLRALQNAVDFAVYTPGSDAGIPVSILASLKAPPIPWEDNREILREKISGTVTALLGLVGLTDIDPVRSREHILLANIFEHAWSQGRDLNLGELILQTSNPPFEKLGVFDVNTFFPEKDRFSLAMLLNNILAAPAFQTWIEGQPLEIPSLLYTPDGRPRHSVFYIAHLPEAERMFFVTLLYSAVETWMRAQAGATSLRAIVYFDEIFGYLPPVSNPPSKQPMLRMLKQARAFGVGQLLVTQNPVDVDYKALSNAGTWFIGKLQTDRDKERLLDGLEGAMAGSLDRGQYDRMISSLGKRVFLLHNVHKKEPQVFQTRWAINYLAGPLTRTQIPALNLLVGAGQPAEEPAAGPPPAGATKLADTQPVRVTAAPAPAVNAAPVPAGLESDPFSKLGSTTRPGVPSGIAEYFLPNDLTLSQAFKSAARDVPMNARRLGLLYRPQLLAQAAIRFIRSKYNLDSELRETALVTEPDRQGVVRWAEHATAALDPSILDSGPLPQARFASLDAPLNDARAIRSLETDFQEWVYRDTTVTVRANEALKIFAGPEVTSAELRRLCSEAASRERDEARKKVADSFNRKIASLEDKLAREERELAQDEEEYQQRRMEELGTHAENVFSLFSKRRRRISTSLTKRRLTAQAKADIEESEQAIKDFERQLDDMEKEMEQALQDVDRQWGEVANQITEITVTPYKKDIRTELFGIAWTPYHIVQVGAEVIELPGAHWALGT